MEMTASYAIAAPRAAVWSALNDPELMRRCIPRCEAMIRTSDTTYEAQFKLSLGPFTARIRGDITLSELNPPESYFIHGEGKGGLLGFAKGGARVRLAEDGGATRLTFVAEGALGGRLARIGASLASGTAQRLADEFFARFAAQVRAQAAETQEPAPAEAAVAGPAAASLPAQAKPAATGTGAPTAIWVAGLVVATLALLTIFSRG